MFALGGLIILAFSFAVTIHYCAALDPKAGVSQLLGLVIENAVKLPVFDEYSSAWL